jgi:hypothetical protein
MSSVPVMKFLFRNDLKVFFIANNKESKIIESFDKDLVFKKDQASKLEMETTDKEQEKYKNLEGKGKSDSLAQDPLSGKGKTSHLNTDPMSMDLKPGDNNLSSEALEQKSQTGKEKTHWDGKNASEKEGKADLGVKADQKINEGSELSLHGKTSHEKFYRNHNESEKFDAKETGGKSSTDLIEGHLSSLNAKKDREKEETNQEKGGSLFDHEKKDREQKEYKEKAAKDLSEKSSTDNLGGSLSSPDGNKSQEKSKQSSELSGKSPFEAKESLGNDSDKQGKHQRSENEESANALSGKSSTDKIGGHLKNPESRSEKDQNKAKTENENERNLFDRAKRDKSAKDADQEIYNELTGHSVRGPSKKSGEENLSYLDGKSNTKEDSGKCKVIPFVAALEKAKVPSEISEAMQEAKITSVIIHNGNKVDCELDDFFDETIIFSTSEPGLTGAKVVSLNLNFNYMNKDTSLKFEGNIKSVEPDGEGANFITVEITKENVSAFNSFMKLYGTRQEHINLFLKTVK